MAVTPVSLGIRSNPGRNAAISAARLINCYAEDAGEEGKIKLPIVASDGFTSFSSIAGGGTGAIRAGLAFSSTVAYVVSGTRIVKVTSGGTATVLTAAAAVPVALASTGLVTMARNRREPNAQIAVACGGHFYIIDSDVITDVSLTALNSGTLVSVCANDGYFILAFDNGEFFITGIDDGTSLDELAFSKAESNPDGLVRNFARSDDVVLSGDKSTEFWRDTGAEDFPYERVATSDFGCFAGASMVAVASPSSEDTDTVAFAATSSEGGYYGVVLLSGYSARKISTPAQDRAIRDGGSGIIGYTYSAGGHIFYGISDLSTYGWEYNLTTGLWHERKSSGLEFWRISFAMTFAGYVTLGDYSSATLYRQSPSLYAGSDSVLTLKHSNDNGASWIVTRTKTISDATNKKQRYKFPRLGQSKEDGKVLQISISNAVMENGVGNDMIVQPPAIHAWPNPMRFFGAYIDVSPGVSQNATAKAITGLAVDAVAVRG